MSRLEKVLWTVVAVAAVISFFGIATGVLIWAFREKPEATASKPDSESEGRPSPGAAPSTPAATPAIVVTGEESPAVKARRKFWEDAKRAEDLAHAKDVSEIKDAKEKRLQAEDKVKYLRGKVRSINQTILNYESDFERMGSKDPSTKAWEGEKIRSWTEKLDEVKENLAKAEAELLAK